MENPLQDRLSLPYGELEDLNLHAKEQRKNRVPVSQIQEERLKYLTDEKRVKAVTVLFSDLEGRLHIGGARVHRNEQQLGLRQTLSDLAGRFDAVEQRHRDVKDDQLRLQAKSSLHKIPPVRDCSNYLKMRSESCLEALPSRCIVVS